MLVLTRRRGESIRIGEDVRVTVVSSTGGHVRISIEAPSEVSIHREELYERIAKANRDAAESGALGLENLAELHGPTAGAGTGAA